MSRASHLTRVVFVHSRLPDMRLERCSTARPTRCQGIVVWFVNRLVAEEMATGELGEVGYGIRITWVDLAEAVDEIDLMTAGLYALLEDAQDSRSRISQRINMDSQRVNLLIGDRMTLQETELQTHRDHVYAYETHLQAHQTQLQCGYSHSDTTSGRVVITARAAEESRQPGPEARIPDHQDASGI
ncbi:hypothetical protein Tco_0389286 [Tanacetum coccineum]